MMSAPMRATLLALALPAVLAAQERPFELEGLVVTATPTPRPARTVSATVTVLDGAELRARGLSRLQDALRGLPGVDVVQSGSFGSVTSVFLRGAESDHVLFLVDGVQVNQPGGAFDLSGMTLDNVERVEVVRGPASALYGSDAVAGVIHVITRAGRAGARGAVSARAGSYGRRDWSAEASGGNGRAGYALSLARLTTDGILPFNNAHDNTVLSGSVRFAPDDATRARLAVRLGDRSYHFPTDGSGALADGNAFTFGDETSVSVSVSRASGRVTLQALLGVSESDGGTDDAADGPADTVGFYGFQSLDHVRRSSADARASLRVRDVEMTAGAEVEEERQRSFTESLSQYGPSSDRSALSRMNRALYGHVSGEAGALAYDVGGRVEDNERFGRLGTWQAGAVWRTGSTRVRASAGRAIKEPTFFENFATGFARGNPELAPERSLSWEVGVERGLAGERLVLGAALFHQRLRDLIQYTFAPPAAGGPNFFNVAAADARGLEVEGRLRSGGFTGSAAWTWLRSEVVDAGFDEGPGATFVEGEPLVRRPRHKVSVQATYAPGSRGSVTLGGIRVGARADRDFSTFPATPVTLGAFLDVFAAAEWSPWARRAGAATVTLTARGENLLDRAHQEVFGFRAPGRTLHLGARLALGGGA